MSQWSKLQTESGVYIMRLDEQSNENAAESTYTIWVSDFIILWNESITRQDLFKRFSEMNPTMATMITNDDVIKTQLIAALGTVANMKHPNVHNNDNDDSKKLQLKYLIFDDQEVEFQWVLKKCGPQEFFDQFTKLLMRQYGEIENQKKEWVVIVKAKDDEIDQYKLEPGRNEIRKRFITKKFDEQKFELPTQMFNCEIDQFESVIGPLSKNVASNESKAVIDESSNAEGQPNQNTSSVKQKSPKGKRNYRGPFRGQVYQLGKIEYEKDSDDDDDNSGSNSASEKRTRQSF